MRWFRVTFTSPTGDVERAVVGAYDLTPLVLRQLAVDPRVHVLVQRLPAQQ